MPLLFSQGNVTMFWGGLQIKMSLTSFIFRVILSKIFSDDFPKPVSVLRNGDTLRSILMKQSVIRELYIERYAIRMYMNSFFGVGRS